MNKPSQAFPLSEAQLSIAYKRAQDLDIEIWEDECSGLPLNRRDQKELQLKKNLFNRDLRVLLAHAQWKKTQTLAMAA